MKIQFILLLWTVLNCYVQAKEKAKSALLEPCDKTKKQPLVIKKFSVKPMPLKFPGKVHLDIVAQTTRPSKGILSGKTWLYKKMWLFGYTAIHRCHKHFGTCHYEDICEEIAEDVEDHGCHPRTWDRYGFRFEPKLEKCTCPLPAVTMNINRTFKLPKVGGFKAFFMGGKYKMEARFYEDKKQVACYRVYFSIDT